MVLSSRKQTVSYTVGNRYSNSVAKAVVSELQSCCTVKTKNSMHRFIACCPRGSKLQVTCSIIKGDYPRLWQVQCTIPMFEWTVIITTWFWKINTRRQTHQNFIYLRMCVCICICMYVCMYVCMHVCITTHKHTHTHTHIHIKPYAHR